jgi:hypothetical protein
MHVLFLPWCILSTAHPRLLSGCPGSKARSKGRRLERIPVVGCGTWAWAGKRSQSRSSRSRTASRDLPWTFGCCWTLWGGRGVRCDREYRCELQCSRSVRSKPISPRTGTMWGKTSSDASLGDRIVSCLSLGLRRGERVQKTTATSSSLSSSPKLSLARLRRLHEYDSPVSTPVRGQATPENPGFQPNVVCPDEIAHASSSRHPMRSGAS